MLAGLRGDFVDAGKRSLAGDTAPAASSNEMTDLRRDVRDLKEGVASPENASF